MVIVFPVFLGVFIILGWIIGGIYDLFKNINNDDVYRDTRIYQNPICPNCGIKMKILKAKRGPNLGKNFYVCPNAKNCKQGFLVETYKK